MICSDTVEEREAALAKIEPMQQADFEALYEALEGCPVTIRFLDPPLHEFVPTEEADIKALADTQGKSVETIKNIIASLHEFNPMMGHRGCRLAVTYPEIAIMQTKAVIKAAIAVSKKHPDWNIVPEIMIPLVGEIKELKYVKNFVVETADAVIKEAGVDLKYEVGTMIEIPRAALTADEIAKEAEFFCFGTNDLTQMTFGFSRDDAGQQRKSVAGAGASPHRTHPPDPGAVCLSRHAPVGRPEVRSPGGGCFPAGPVGLSAELHPSPNRQGDGLYLLAAGNRAVDAVRTHKAHMTKRRGVVTPPYALCIELFVGRGQCAPPHNERSGYSKHLQGGGRPCPPPTIKIHFYRADRVVRLYIKGWPPAFADDHPFLT